MPPVIVQYSRRFSVDIPLGKRSPVLKSINDALCQILAKGLSIKARKLKEGEFMITCQMEGPDDRFIHDLQIFVPAHNDPERVKTGSQTISESVRTALEPTLQAIANDPELWRPIRAISFSVAPMLVDMGYATGSVIPNRPPPKR